MRGYRQLDRDAVKLTSRDVTIGRDVSHLDCAGRGYIASSKRPGRSEEKRPGQK